MSIYLYLYIPYVPIYICLYVHIHAIIFFRHHHDYPFFSSFTSPFFLLKRELERERERDEERKKRKRKRIAKRTVQFHRSLSLIRLPTIIGMKMLPRW